MVVPACSAFLASSAIGASVAATPSSLVPSVAATAFPVFYSSDKRFLQDANGKPFPILGRSVWFITSLLAADYGMVIDDSVARGFLHSHSYTGNPLACRAACAVLDLFEREDVIAANERKAARFFEMASPLAHHPQVRDFRHLGMIWAFEVAGDSPDFASRAFEIALARGVLLRPIGRTVYFMPPYVTGEAEFALLVQAGLEIVERLGK